MRTLLVLLLAISASACGDKIDAIQETECTGSAPVTFEAQIRPLLTQFCTGCHASNLAGAARSGAPSGVNFDSFEAARASAAAANQRVQNGTMPPADPKPSAEQRQTFHCWVEQGTPER